MSWPLISDFSRMIRNPSVAFKDPDLKSCEIECDQLGQPKPRSGNFATVYRAFCADGSERAIRVFNRRAEERRERYAACSRFLEANPLHSLVRFTYAENGVRSAGDGKLYPLVVMEWVDGLTLFDWVRARCKEGYADALRIGAEVWLQVVNELQQAGVAHGDLQHGNVMVTRDGHFKLVDYDCLAVPELMGRPNLETGLPPYQHPARDATTVLSADLDNFSSLVIYTALRALAAQPQMWFTHVETPGYDKLLFRSDDFRQPQQSALYGDLMNSPDPLVRNLTQHLFQLAAAPSHQCPTVEDVITWSSSLAELIQRQDWDGVVRRAERLRPGEQLPPEYETQIAVARRRVEARRVIQAAFEAGDEARIAEVFQPELFENYPAAAALAQQAAIAQQAARVVEVLRSSLQLQCWDAFRKTYQENEALLSGRPSGEALTCEYRKLEAVAELKRLLADDNSDDEQLVTTWRWLRGEGGHEAVNEIKPQLERRVTRKRFFESWETVMRQAHGNPSLKKDQQMVAAWMPEFFDGWARAEQTRPHLQTARSRIKQFERFQEMAEKSGEDIERALLGAAQQLTHDYHPSIKPRAELALRRVKAAHDFQDSALRAETEEQVLDLWAKLEESGDAEAASDSLRQRVELARKRLPLLRRLRALDSLPPAAANEQLLMLWDEQLLSDCREVDPWRQRYADALERAEKLKRLQSALDAKDLKTARKLATAGCFTAIPLPRAVRKQLESLEQEQTDQVARHRQQLLDALLGNDRKRFRELFDLGMLRELCGKAPHHEQVVENWTTAEVLPLFVEAVRESEPFGVQRLEEGGFHASWAWPEQFASVRIRLAVFAAEPNERTRFDRVEPVYSTVVYRKGWLADGQGHTLANNPEWLDHHVAVWGVFDLGFQTLITPCIALGKLTAPAKKSGWTIFRRG